MKHIVRNSLVKKACQKGNVLTKAMRLKGNVLNKVYIRKHNEINTFIRILTKFYKQNIQRKEYLHLYIFQKNTNKNKCHVNCIPEKNKGYIKNRQNKNEKFRQQFENRYAQVKTVIEQVNWFGHIYR